MLIQSFSGIRGIYGRDLTEDTASRYAYTFNEFLRKRIKNDIREGHTKEGCRETYGPLVVVGYDTRPSNNSLKKAIFSSLSGIIDAGVVPVAAAQLAVREFKADGGIMLTASHNEPEYNGFKFLDRDGALLRPADINRVISSFNEISRLSKEEFLNLRRGANKGDGKNGKIGDKNKKADSKKKTDNQNKNGDNAKADNKNKEIISGYSDFLKRIIGDLDNKLKIIIDVNGGSGVILNEVLDKLKIANVKVINTRPGEFKRKIEPDESSLGCLIPIIKRENAEFAVGFDCDGDRAEILLEDGSLADGNYLLALLADYILDKHKGAVVVNDATSNIVRIIAQKHNCIVKEVEVGEINVVDEMLRLNSPIGGEGSNGGIIIPPSRCRDGILSTLYLLKIIGEKNKPLIRMIRELPSYCTLQKKVRFSHPVDIGQLRSMKDKIRRHYSDKGCPIQETGGITGGLKIITSKESFVWFRLSKTEPELLRIIADSASKKGSEGLLDEACSIL